MRHPGVKAELARLAGLRAQRTEVTKDRIVRELAAIALADPLDFFERTEAGELVARDLDKMEWHARASIAQLKLSPRTGALVDIKMVPKNAALDMLCRHNAMYADNMNLSINGADLRTMSEAELVRYLAGLRDGDIPDVTPPESH